MAATTMSLEQYLYGPPLDPDVEFLDGELKERPMTMSIHVRLQTIIGAWFEAHSSEWGVVAAVEVRTRVAHKRVRLPDIVVDPDTLWPGTLVDPPIARLFLLPRHSRKRLKNYAITSKWASGTFG